MSHLVVDLWLNCAYEQKTAVQLCFCSPHCAEPAARCCPQVFAHMQARGVDADVVTCCSLISALERGGQWHLAQQLFLDMCRAAAAAGSPQVNHFSAVQMFRLPAGACT